MTGLAAVLLAGCKKDEIAVYRVPKEKPPQQPMAAAHDHASAPEMSAHNPGIQEHPVWKTPAGWTEIPPGQLSVGSFSFKNAGQEGQVSILPFPREVPELQLVNVWRQSLKLPEVDGDTLKRRTEAVSVNAQQGKLYDIVGADTDAEKAVAERFFVAVLQRNGVTWFFKLQGGAEVLAAEKPRFVEFLSSIQFQEGPPDTMAAASSPAPGNEPEAPAGGPVLPAWEVPSHWRSQPPTSMLLAKFSVTGGGEGKTEVTVSSFGGPAGGLLANVNRWQRQLSLAETDEASLSGLTHPLDLPAGKAILVEMSGTDAKTQKPGRIVAAILPRGNETWFYKMMGDPAAAESEKPAFLKFLQSLKYEAAAPRG